MSNYPLLNAIEAMTTTLSAVDLAGGHPARAALIAEVQRLGSAARALASLADAPDPTATTAAHAKRTMDAATKLIAQVGAARDRLHTINREGLQDLEKSIAAKVNLKPDGDAPEVRDMFRRLNNTRQQQLLVELANENRGPELAALILAKRSTTGLTQEACGRYRDLVVATHAREEHDQSEAVMETFLQALDVCSTIVRFAERFIDPATRARIERGETAAAAAAAAFEQAVGA